MLAPRYIPTDLQAVNYDRGMVKHQRKLEEIQKDDRKRKVVDKEGPARAKLYETREKNLKFHNSEKLLAIEKDNEILLGRLVEISRKRAGAVSLSKSTTSTTLPKTLNGPSRQREKDRIALENEAFAKRLLSQQPRFNRKKLELDYGKHQGLVKQIQRLDNPSTRKLKLPPLKDKKSPTEEEKEDLAEEEERREKEEKEKKEKEEKEAQEKKEHEEKEKKEKEDAERKAKEEKERKEKEEKEAHEKAEREKKEKEEAEKKAEEEEKAKLGRTEEEDKKWEKIDDRDGDNPMIGMLRGGVKSKEDIEAEKKKQEEEEKKKKEEEDKKWDKIDDRDGDNPMIGMMKGLATKK